MPKGNARTLLVPIRLACNTQGQRTYFAQTNKDTGARTPIYARGNLSKHLPIKVFVLFTNKYRDIVATHIIVNRGAEF